MGLVIFHYKIRKDVMLVLPITNACVRLILNAMPFMTKGFEMRITLITTETNSLHFSRHTFIKTQNVWEVGAASFIRWTCENISWGPSEGTKSYPSMYYPPGTQNSLASSNDGRRASFRNAGLSKQN